MSILEILTIIGGLGGYAALSFNIFKHFTDKPKLLIINNGSSFIPVMGPNFERNGQQGISIEFNLRFINKGTKAITLIDCIGDVLDKNNNSIFSSNVLNTIGKCLQPGNMLDHKFKVFVRKPILMKKHKCKLKLNTTHKTYHKVIRAYDAVKMEMKFLAEEENLEKKGFISP